MPQLRHLTKTTHLTREWVEGTLFPLCDQIRNSDSVPASMTGKALYCLFYEPSFLTRTSFERAVGLLGGQAYHTEDASQHPCQLEDGRGRRQERRSECH